ncbi:hypothetical protein E2C01_004547 [Portunus trituberculatus]|uniref:Uncharacterized protein n=1 Tax=Portunus trituberculatus TaxID=210409 RepID=A0A5B7CQA0_PORTR|nr:hypothetical protein [Portunus trituberculatus]
MRSRVVGGSVVVRAMVVAPARRVHRHASVVAPTPDLTMVTTLLAVPYALPALIPDLARVPRPFLCLMALQHLCLAAAVTVDKDRSLLQVLSDFFHSQLMKQRPLFGAREVRFGQGGKLCLS